MGGFKKAIQTAANFGAIKSVKSEEQPKVAAQMDAPVPENTTAGPTTTEMDNANTIAAKRRGRRNTILTSVTGIDAAPQLGKKSLLG